MFEDISSFQDFTARDIEGTMLGIRNNEKNNLELRIEALRSAYKDPFDMLFETVIEKEIKANLQYTAPQQN